MSLSDTYKEYIIEKLMIEYFERGEIPTADQLETDLAEYQETHPDLSAPLSSISDFSVERGTSSSASKIENIATIVQDDVTVLSREIYNRTEISSRFYDRWSFEAKRISARAKQLEHKIDSLLLLKDDTAGFFSYVGDTFVDMSRVDGGNTNAKFNKTDQSITIAPSQTEDTDASRGAQLNLTELTAQDVSFQPLSNRAGTNYDLAPGDSSLLNIFKTERTTWTGVITCPTTGDMVCELKANISDEPVNISKVSMQFTSPIGSTQSTISLQYSADGYKWFLVPAVDATKSLITNLAWTFPKVEANYLKWIIRKAAPDEGNDYIFEISQVKVFADSFSTSPEGYVLQSKAQQALDVQENPVKFSLVALDTCEEIPNETGINYYISASKDNTTWTDWTTISPSDYEGVQYPKVINLGGVDTKDNDDIDSSIRFDTSVSSQKKLTRLFDNTEEIPGLEGYHFKEANFAAINTAIVISSGEDPDPIGGSVIVWRNVRFKERNNYPDTELVRGIERGWHFDGGQYSCFFEIINSDGVILNFGDKACVLDDAEVSGIVTVNKGIHKFVTDSNNWLNISDNLISYGNVNSEEELIQLDPLYPNNHKMVIEGYPYPETGWVGERVYLGTDISAEYYSQKVSLFDLENNSTDYSTFSVRGVGNVTNPTLSVITNFDVSNPDYSNELFSTRWRSGEAGTEMYTSIKLKAELWTDNAAKSPVLYSYRLKLGV